MTGEVRNAHRIWSSTPQNIAYLGCQDIFRFYYISIGQLDERITTSATGYYQLHVRRFQDYRILFEGSVTFRLTTKLAFPLRVNFRYDNEPPTTIRKHDVEIFNGLRYTF